VYAKGFASHPKTPVTNFMHFKPCLHALFAYSNSFTNIVLRVGKNHRSSQLSAVQLLERKQRAAAAVSLEMPANRKDKGIKEEVESEEECFV